MNQCITHADATHVAVAFVIAALVVLFGGLGIQEVRRWLRNRAYQRERAQKNQPT